MFWTNKYENDNVHKFGEFLAHGFHKEDKSKKRYLDKERPKTFLYLLCEWIHQRQGKRKIEVHIDGYDAWSADYSLSLIALPLLKKLRENLHGAGYTDDEDVPEHLRSTAAPAKENEWDTDANHFARWEWILDEMIWAHQQIVTDDEPDFWIKKPEGAYFEECEDNPKLSTYKHDVEGEYDHEASKAYNERISNGLKLFGKYYRGLWD